MARQASKSPRGKYGQHGAAGLALMAPRGRPHSHHLFPPRPRLGVPLPRPQTTWLHAPRCLRLHQTRRNHQCCGPTPPPQNRQILRPFFRPQEIRFFVFFTFAGLAICPQ
jgi:hypothetical protein